MKDKPKNYLYKRYKTLIPRTKDLTLVLLKGHLLLEEQLTDFIKASCEHPIEIDELRLSFAPKEGLARALCARAMDSHEWQFVKRINRLRNQMAHTLEVPSVSAGVSSNLQKMHKGGQPYSAKP